VSEDAVSPVVAVMLILAIVVTFFAAWNAYYVPSMKAQSEITHLKDVESGFLRFSSDIETATSLKKNMKLSEPIPLGGGDFAFDPVKSGGELKIWNASQEGFLHQDWTSETEPGNPGQSFGLVKFSYTPVNNFWQDQGYGWMNGNVYVLNTERNLSTPLQFYNTTDITYGLAGSLVEVEAVPSYSSPGNCSSITIHTVNITPDSRHSHISGNGNGMLVLESKVDRKRVLNATSLTLNIVAPSGRFGSNVWNSVNASAVDAIAPCGNVKRILPDDPDEQKLQLIFLAYPYPEITLIRETTEISIGAY
jgi:hypothetical protein